MMDGSGLKLRFDYILLCGALSLYLLRTSAFRTISTVPGQRSSGKGPMRLDAEGRGAGWVGQVKILTLRMAWLEYTR